MSNVGNGDKFLLGRGFVVTWVDSKKKSTPLYKMTTPHILNCIKMVKKCGGVYKGRNSGEWLTLFKKELSRRKCKKKG